MIFAINKTTKEHRILEGAYWRDDEHDYVRADEDGWIEWYGWECPLPDGSVSDIRYRYPQGKELHAVCPAEGTDWSEVVAYRPNLSGSSESDVPQYVKVDRIDFSMYDWWTEGKRYEVITEKGVKGVEADDGDFYPLDGSRLAGGGHFVPCSDEPEASEWSGEGLPPVGCECEVKINNQKWEKYQVVGYFDKTRSVFLYMTPYTPEVYEWDDCDFRPIRSKEDVAVDALSKAMKAASEDGIDILEDKVCCRVVYHAIRDGKVPGVNLED